ncbi:hypothetical protein Tco_1427545 [Tanacetum coccineum]
MANKAIFMSVHGYFNSFQPFACVIPLHSPLIISAASMKFNCLQSRNSKAITSKNYKKLKNECKKPFHISSPLIRLLCFGRPVDCKASEGSEVQLSAKHHLVIKGLVDGKASTSNLGDIKVKDIVKEIEDYLKTYSSAEMDIRCKWNLSVPQRVEAGNSIKLKHGGK